MAPTDEGAFEPEAMAPCDNLRIANPSNIVPDQAMPKLSPEMALREAVMASVVDGI